MGFDHKLLPGTNRIARDASCCHRAPGRPQQHQQQQMTGFATRPRGAIEDAVGVLERLPIRASHNPHDGGHGALAGSQNRSDHPQFGPFLPEFAACLFNVAQHRSHPFRQCGHTLLFSLKRLVNEASSAFRLLPADGESLPECSADPTGNIRLAGRCQRDHPLRSMLAKAVVDLARLGV
jgi:hypothetical protein